MESSRIDQLKDMSNHYRKSASEIPDLPQELTLLISKGYNYSLSELISLYDLISQNKKLLLYWFTLLLIKLKSRSPVDDGNALLYFQLIIEFIKNDSDNINFILYEYSIPLNLEIAASKSEHLYLWAYKLSELAENEFISSPISHLVSRLKIESLNLLTYFLEEQIAGCVEEIVKTILCIQLLKRDYYELLNEITRSILNKTIEINDLDGVKSLLGQKCSPDQALTQEIIETITPLEEYLSKKNTKLLNQIKSYLISKRAEKKRKNKSIHEEELKSANYLNQIVYEPRPIYGHTFQNFSVSISRGIRSDGIPVILKQYSSFSDKFDSSNINNEIKIMTFLSNRKQSLKNVLELYYVQVNKSDIYILMEDGGKSLMDYITELKHKHQIIHQSIIERWITELIECFALMSNFGINHCDIKPHNLLLNEKDMSIKVIDFNISQITGEVQSTMSITQLLPIQGTEGYMAPEIELAQRESLKETYYKAGKSDVFSLGLTFLQLITFEKLTGLNMRENHQLLMRKVESLNCNAWIIILLKNMLEIDRKKRFCFNKFIKFINSNLPTLIIN